MGENTKISWATHSWSPWWGCSRVSPGCEHCYAESFAKRVGHSVTGSKLPIWGASADRRFMSDEHWKQPLRWNRKAERAGVRARVFCASMADVFEPGRDRVGALMNSERAKLWKLIEATPNLDWLLLTKRPAMISRFVPYGWMVEGCPSNVWLGTTAEDQKRADERIGTLLEVPAAIRFISYEPALEAVDFSPWIDPMKVASSSRPLDWIIVGGESGPKARRFDVAWARDVLRAARGTATSLFVKQLGANAHDSARSIVGGWAPGDSEPDTRLRFKDRAAENWLEWPAEFRVREIPIPFPHRPAHLHPSVDRITLSSEVLPA